METNLEFKNLDVDDISLIPNRHFSFIVQQLLPVRLVGRFRCENYMRWFLGQPEVKKLQEDDNVTLVPVGSLAEGLSMPPVCNRKSKDDVHMENNTDQDVMRVEPRLATFKAENIASGDYWCLLETTGMHPGYVKLNISKQATSPKFQSRISVQNQIALMIMPTLKPQRDKIGVQGPAITTSCTIKKEPMTFSKHVYKRDKLHLQDTVFAISCPEWPPMAKSWIERQRRHKWMTEDFIASLITDGCHVVPAAHRQSTNPDKEWRVSFTAAEGRIAREVVTDQQRQVYVFVKILYNQVLKQKQIITSYHLKTVFLYACEHLAEPVWADNPGACVLFLLDLVIECLKKKTIPNYFIPENNLIDYLTEEKVQEITQTFMDLRVDPITPVLDFTDERVVGFACFSLTFRCLLEPILQDMKEYPKHMDWKQSVLQAVIPVVFKNLITHMAERKFEESVHIAEDLHSMLIKEKLTEDTFPEFCYYNVANTFSDTSKSASFLEKVIELHGDDPSIETCKSNLACMYHAASYRYQPGSGANREYLEKAERAFKAESEEREKENASGSNCDYALFLMKQSRLSEAIALLEKGIERNNLSEAAFYDANELMVLDEVLQAEVLDHKKLTAPSVSLAYYLLIKCLVDKTCTTQANELLQKFKLHADEVNLPRAYALYGYSCMRLDEWESGEEAFETAFKTNVGSEYTRALKMKNICTHQLKRQNQTPPLEKRNGREKDETETNIKKT